METRCVSFRFRRALGPSGGKNEAPLISGTTRAWPTRAALTDVIVCASKKRGKRTAGVVWRVVVPRLLGTFQSGENEFIGCCCRSSFKMTMIPPFRGWCKGGHHDGLIGRSRKEIRPFLSPTKKSASRSMTFCARAKRRGQLFWRASVVGGGSRAQEERPFCASM